MTRTMKWLAASLALVVCLCVSVLCIPSVRAVILENYIGNEEIEIDGLIFDEEHGDEDYAADVEWQQTAAHTIIGTQWETGQTDTLVMTAEWDGRLAFSFAPVNELEQIEGDMDMLSFSLEGEAVQPVQYDGEYVVTAILHAGEEFRVTLTDTGTTGDGAVITMTNFYFLPPTEYTVTITPDANGSVVYETDGTEHTVTAAEEVTYDNFDGIRITATPNSGYKFAYWEDGEGNANGNMTVEYTDRVPGDTLTPHFLDENYQVNYVVDNHYYEDWSSAFSAARTSGTKFVVALRYGGALELAADAEPDGTFIVADGSSVKYVIPAGYKLLVPYNTAETGTFHELQETSPSDTTEFGGNNQSVFAKVTVPANVTLEVVGELNVNAQQYKKGQRNGQVAGQYGQLAVNGAVNVVDGAGFYCYGYATGSGRVTARPGATVHELLQVRDWPGGSNAFNWFTGFVNKKLLAGEDGGSFVFNQYYAQNIECEYDICAGAASYMNYTLFLSQNGTKVTICAAMPFTGTNGLFDITSGHMLRHYDAAADRMIYDIYGSVVTGSVGIPLGRFGVDATISSEQFILGINNHLTLNVHSGGYLKLNSSYQLLPEFSASVDYGGTMEVADGTTLYIWDKDDWNAGNYAFGGKAWDMVYSPTRTTPTVTSSRPMRASTNIDINGTLIMHNNVYTTDNGGTDIAKAIYSSDGTGVIQNTEGSTTPNLRVIGRTDFGSYNGAVNAAESYTYYPLINCSIVVGHMYEQENDTDYAPILTGEYKWKNVDATGHYGWYNNAVLVYDMDNMEADPIEYPVGTDSFVLKIDDSQQEIFADYQLLTNAEYDAENTVILANRDGSELYYSSLGFKVGQGAEIAVKRETYDYIFGWYEQTLDNSVRNQWYGIVTGSPADTTASTAYPYSALELYQMAQAAGNDMLNAFNKVYGVSTFEDLQWGIGLMNGTNSLYDSNGQLIPEAYAKAAPILGQLQAGVANSVTSDGSSITGVLNQSLAANHYVMIPMLTNYSAVNVTWRINYPDGTVASATGDTYTVPEGERFIIDGTPEIYGNQNAVISDESTMKSVTVVSAGSGQALAGDITVDVKLKAYAYEVNYTVTNTSATDSSKVFSLPNVTWEGAYNRHTLAFGTTYVDADGKDVATGKAIRLTYTDLTGYDALDDGWKTYSSRYSDTYTTEGKFAFAGASAVNASAVVTNTRDGSALSVTGITGDASVTVGMYVYHYVVDRTVIEDGESTQDIEFVLYGTKLGPTLEQGKAFKNVSFTMMDGTDLFPNITPYDHEITSSENLQFTLITNAFNDAILEYEIKSFDYIVRYGFSTAATATAAMSAETSIYYVERGESFDVPIPSGHGRVILDGYYLFDLAGAVVNTSGGIAVDISDPEVMRLSSVTRDIRVIGREAPYDKKVTWKQDGEILRKDFLVGDSADATYDAPDGYVITSAVPEYIVVNGSTVGITSTAEPVKSVTLTTTGTGYDVIVNMTMQGYGYEVNFVDDEGLYSTTKYLSDGDTVTLRDIYVGGKSYVITGVSGAEGLTVTGPGSDYNSDVAWGWPSATFAGFTGDRTVTLTLKEYYNAVLWNTTLVPADAGYVLRKWSYVAQNEPAVLSVPAPYIVTNAIKGTNEEIITDVSFSEHEVTAEIDGDGSVSVKVTAKKPVAEITWVIDGVTTTEYAFDTTVYKTLEGKRIVESCEADNGTQVAVDGQTIILTEIAADTTVTVTSLTYDHKLTLNYYDSYLNTLNGTTVEYVSGDTFNKVFAADEYLEFVEAEVVDGQATVSAVSGGFSVTGMGDEAEVDVFVLKTEERLYTNLSQFTNHTRNAATITVTDSAYGVFTVTCSKACVVAIDNGDGTYTRLKATPTGTADTYEFKLSADFPTDIRLVVAIKGDVTVDGRLNVRDETQLLKALLPASNANHVELSGLALFIANADEDANGRVNVRDQIKIQKALLTADNPNYSPFSW